MSKSKLIKDSAIYTLGDVLPKAIAFFMIPVYTKYLSTKDYGIVNIVMITGTITSMFYILGLNGSLTRYYYDYNDTDKQKEIISTFWIFTVAYNILLTILLLLFGGRITGMMFKSIPFEPFFKLMILNCLFANFSVIPLTIFRLREKPVRYGIYSGLAIIANIAFIIYFVVSKGQGAEGNLKGYVYSNAVFSIIYTFAVFKDLRPVFSFKFLKEGLKYGLPLIPHSIGGWVLSVSDRMFLERYGTLDEIGVYSLGYQFGLLLDYVLGGINKAYVPFFFKTASENKNAAAVFEEVIKYYSVFVLTIGLGVAMFSKEITLIMVSNKSYYGAMGIIPLISVVSVLHGYYYMSVNGIFYCKNTKVLAVTTTISALVAILMNFLLIPRYGMYGAAFATMTAYVVLFLMTYHQAQKSYYIKWHWRQIAVNAVLCLIAYFAATVTIDSLMFGFIYKVFVFAVYMVMLFMFKILSADKFKALIGKLGKKVA